MGFNPTPTGGFDTHYASTTPSDGKFWVYNDPNCTDPDLWQSIIDLEFYQSFLKASFTNEVSTDVGAVQIIWASNQPEVLEFGDETCDVQTSFSLYARKNLTFSGMTPTGLDIVGTGVVGSDRLVCTDGLREVFRFSVQVGLPTNEQFLQDPQDSNMLDMILTY